MAQGYQLLASVQHHTDMLHPISTSQSLVQPKCWSNSFDKTIRKSRRELTESKVYQVDQVNPMAARRKANVCICARLLPPVRYKSNIILSVVIAVNPHIVPHVLHFGMFTSESIRPLLVLRCHTSETHLLSNLPPAVLDHLTVPVPPAGWHPTVYLHYFRETNLHHTA